MNNQSSQSADDHPRKEQIDCMKFEYERLWDYFEYHAQQRMISFRLFVIMAGLVSSGFISLLYVSSHPASGCTNLPTSCIVLPKLLWVMLVLGLIIIVLSFVFWKLDKRNNIMINESRAELQKMEEQEHIKYTIYTNVDSYTEKHGGMRVHHCFNTIFSLFAIIGLSIIIYSICHILHS